MLLPKEEVHIGILQTRVGIDFLLQDPGIVVRMTRVYFRIGGVGVLVRVIILTPSQGRCISTPPILKTIQFQIIVSLLMTVDDAITRMWPWKWPLNFTLTSMNMTLYVELIHIIFSFNGFTISECKIWITFMTPVHFYKLLYHLIEALPSHRFVVLAQVYSDRRYSCKDKISILYNLLHQDSMYWYTNTIEFTKILTLGGKNCHHMFWWNYFERCN